MRRARPSAEIPGRGLLLGIPVAWAAAFLLLPMAGMVAMSVGSRPEHGGVRYDGSGEAYGWMWAQRALIGRSAWLSLRLALLATFVTVAVATPVAWWIARAPPRRRALYLLLVVVPSWTSFLLRTYAWRFLFGTEGPVNELLGSLSVGTVRFLNTETAVVIGLVYGYLPFAVLPIYVAVERLDPDVLAAARDLGAGPARAFVRVALPLTSAGTVAGAVLVFVPSVAAFVTPQMLGGADTYMLGQLVQDRFLNDRNWPTGAALGVGLTVVALLALLPLRARRARA